ncbi:MAG: molybdate ABC transporter substrate-binding protein [Clostridium sp.]|uniref:molybdate ABC transporter substrate-binding protein n=1 Tax=Clostridium sp. TaxID=1506 RepID=UPI002FC81200
MCKKVIPIILAVFLLISIMVMGCGNKTDKELSSDKGELKISIAASLQKPMEKIGNEFTKETGIKVKYNIGGSGTLEKQIVQGGDTDLFLSANKKYSDDLVKDGIVDKNDCYNILTNSLVLIEGNDVKKNIKDINELKNIRGKIAVGEVATVPAGQYTKETLENLKLWDKLRDKLIYSKSVTSVKNYVESGDVDYGFVYKTDGLDLKNSKIAYEVPNKYHSNIEYSLCLIKDSKNRDDCNKFIKYLKDKNSKDIFKQYGFGVEE